MASDLISVPNDLEFEATIRRLEITQQVFERYKLLRILGRGGMGVVWLAHDERLDREVALKFLPDELGFDPEAEDEMKRETRRCLDLTHVNIVRIYDFIKDRQAAAIAMEYIDGKTLSAIKVERPKRFFDTDELRPWLTQACRALSYAHDEVGVIHRDLKPGNLMLTSRGQIKIADFGIAQSVSDSMGRMTIRRGTSGTLSYMSPQQMNGEIAQVTDDVYAMGATIYELLTSKPPFHSGNVSFQLRVMIPPSIQERRDEFEIRASEIPKDWEEGIAACLGKCPEERPSSMHELAERLGLVPAHRSVLHKAQEPTWSLPKLINTVHRLSGAVREKAKKLDWKTTSYRKFGIFALLALVLVASLRTAWHFILWPQIAPRAEFQVTSIPPGAVVRIPGRPDTTTPTTISQLRMGTYSVTISAPGYDSIQKNIHLNAGAKLDLGTIVLTRAYGQWSISTLPRRCHYVLKGDVNTGNLVKEGFTPDFAPTLPAGHYVINLTQSNFSPYSESIEVPAHGLKAEEVDLIRGTLAADSNSAPAKAFRGDIDPSKLSFLETNEFINLSDRAFEQYLVGGFLARAAQELEDLKKLNVDVSAKQLALQTRRASKEAEVIAVIAKFVNAGRFASASYTLKDVEGDLETDSIARLNVRFQNALAPYQQLIDASLKSIIGIPPADAQKQLLKLMAQHPDDIRLQLAFGNLLTQLPPEHSKLSAQLDAFRRMADQDKSLLADPSVLKLSAILDAECRKLDALTKEVGDSKSALAASAGRVDRLKSQKNAYEDRRIGKPKVNPFAGTLNFFGKVVTGHSVIDSEAVFSSRQEKEEAIASIQTQIDTAELSLPPLQMAQDNARKRYDQFMANVPWNQN